MIKLIRTLEQWFCKSSIPQKIKILIEIKNELLMISSTLKLVFWNYRKSVKILIC